MAEQDVIDALEALESDIETLNTNIGLAVEAIESNTARAEDLITVITSLNTTLNS